MPSLAAESTRSSSIPRDGNHVFVGSALAVRGPLARDRQRQHDPARAGRERPRPLRVDRRAALRSPRSGAGTTRVRSASPSSASTRSTWMSSTPRRSTPECGAGMPEQVQTTFTQVFASAVPGRRYRPDDVRADREERTHSNLPYRRPRRNGAGISGANASNFWRTDNANQPAAALLASQGRGGPLRRNPSTHTFPASYNGWQNLTSKMTGNPYFATDNFLHRPVLVRRGRLHAGRHARHRLRDRLETSTASSRATRTASAAATAAPTGAKCSTPIRLATPTRQTTCARSPICRTMQRSTIRPRARIRAVLRQRMPERAERYPSRPARDRDQSSQPDPDFRRLGRRNDSHERIVRRRLVAVRLAVSQRRRPAASDVRQLQRRASDCCRGCRR